ncbi:PAS domain-containing protein [Roseomonas sp. SG15]|uniref:PAS domain-containing protein n=1 Tax=Roseomonas indoligenes TaxID=2820811 RepID=A0A940N0K8_9PROT|nr:PAS domain-containing protein [Pararoseomonas indoligenes]
MAPAFLTGGGETGALMRGHDWSSSPLGDPAGWPPRLQSVVELLLGSKFPMFVAWGAELGFLYNDAYAEILGAKHPRALGARFHDIWAEIWPDILPLIETAMAGVATYREDLPLLMNRRGFDEQTWFTFSYSPVRDEEGRVAGMFCAVAETTARVLMERKQAFLVRLGDALRGLDDPHALPTLAAELLGTELGADRSGYGIIDASGEVVSVERDWTAGRVASLAGEARILDAFGPAVIAELRAGRTLVVEDCQADPRTSHPAYLPTWDSIGTRALIVAPLIRSGRLAAILYVHSGGPRHWMGGSRRSSSRRRPGAPGTRCSGPGPWPICARARGGCSWPSTLRAWSGSTTGSSPRTASTPMRASPGSSGWILTVLRPARRSPSSRAPSTPRTGRASRPRCGARWPQGSPMRPSTVLSGPGARSAG